MAPALSQTRSHLARLVSDPISLRRDGRFYKRHLDGSPGAYVSFKSWEWLQGVGLHGLVHPWQHNGDKALRRTIEGRYVRRLADGVPQININTIAPLLAPSLLSYAARDPRWEKPLADWVKNLLRGIPRTSESGFRRNVLDAVNDNELWDDIRAACSIPMGSGTEPYAFGWGMTGEDQGYEDVSPAPAETLQ